MAEAMQNSFELFVTCVDKMGPILKIWGQTDRNNSMFVEQLLKSTFQSFETVPVIQNLSELSVGLLCCAKYKDGNYYRAQITNVKNMVSRSVEVIFIDYGNAELIGIENIRLLNNVPAGLLQIKPQATEFVLANIMHVNKNWDETSLALLHQDIGYMELRSTIVSVLNNHRFVKVTMENIDLADYLIAKGFAVHVPLEAQEAWFRSKAIVPSGSGLFQQVPGVMVAPRPGYINTAASMHPDMLQTTMGQTQQLLYSYKSLPLPANSEHMVYVSYVEDGPYLFSIQLQAHEDFLEKLMNDINVSQLLPLTEPPVPGYPCMARCIEDESLCRAVVINMVEEKCKTYYVDFGNTDILPFSNIFQIPLKFVIPKVMSMRFTLAGLTKVNVTDAMKCAFKEFVTNKLLKLKVLKLDSSPVIQYCELYDGDTNITDILYESANKYKTIQISKGLKYSVIVSFITGCKKFFVQLKESSDSLNKLMVALASTCENSPNLQEAHEEMPCVAFYSADNQWYRAQIMSVTGSSITVRYVDYGNEETVAQNYLKTIDTNFVKILPAQAIECCLYGYQNMSFNDEIESVFESLTLECEFTMKVISKQTNQTLLVDLFDAAGNNVAALLIEKLAAQKSQISPLSSNQITKSVVSREDVLLSPKSEKSSQGKKSPGGSNEQLGWRNSNETPPWRGSAEKKTHRNTNNEKNLWRSAETSPPKDTNNWNGDSPTNKRFNQRTDRQERTHARGDNKSDRFSDNKRSPRSDFGKGSTSFNSGSDSEKSFGSRSGKKLGSKRDFKQNKSNENFKHPEPNTRRKVEPPVQNLAPLEEQFRQMEIAPNTAELLAISWFYNPEVFYGQILANQKEFRDMMCDIQAAYNDRQSLDTVIEVGSSVIAEFPEDTILYRARILENKHPKYKVQYVDFGNVSVVDLHKIWQVERKFMGMPMQAVKCGIAGVKPAHGTWPVTDVIDEIFNKESFTASVQDFLGDKYTIQLYDNDVNVKQQLLDSGVALDSAVAFEIDDEPIEMNILMGQNLNCYISFVHGLERFYVYIEKDKAAQVRASVNAYMKSITIASLQRFAREQLEVGATCLVKVADDAWNRGVITNNVNPQALQIDYPDIGGSAQYSMEEIYMLPSPLCAYWYQAFECSLHNLSSAVSRLMTDEDFKHKYEGKDVVIYVDEIVDNRLVATLYETDGTKVNLIDPDEGAYVTIDPLCAMPVLKSSMQVWVSHVNNASSVYLQRDSDSTVLATLLEKLFEHYDTREEVTELSVGDLCCAKSELYGNWYRGKVESITADTCTVLYVDYGNTESLPRNNLKALDLRTFNSPELALNVGLNVQEVSADLTAKLTELTEEKRLRANVFYAECGWLADLFDGESSVNQTLIDLNLAAPRDESVPKFEEVKELDTKTADETNDGRAKIAITHIDSPSEFYVQLLANTQSISDLQAELQEKIATLPDLEGADVGVLCAAKYSVDEQWYRAEVLDADADITTVRFVDYGNTDVINNTAGFIKTLPADLLAIDKYASKCSLNVKPTKSEEWPQEAFEMFESSVNTDTLYANIVYQDEKSKTFVDLFVDGHNVADQLLGAQLAVPIVRDAEENIASNTGFVSHLNSISEFWIQLESSVPDLEMIVDRLASADTFPDLQDLSPGILCAANFPDDEMWYRARILSNTVAGIEVLFVDYGNSSTAMKLKVLPEDLVQMPILAQKCSLQKPSAVGVWSATAVDKFRDISEDGVTIFTIKKLTAGETSVVELFTNGSNIVDQLTALCEASTSEAGAHSTGEPNIERVRVTHIESPSYFWVQQALDMEKIDEIMDSLSAAGSFEKLTDWNADTTCAALYTDSGLWYRAKILEYGDQYEVLLIDYGNTLCTNDIRAIPEGLESVPPLATLCALEYPQDVSDWTDAACTKFQSVVSNGSTDCRAEFVDRDFPAKVRLFIDGKNVTEEICSDTPYDVKMNANVLGTETIMLAENTPLPEADLDANDESFNLDKEVKGNQTIYVDCETMKEEDADHNASFMSCGNDTVTGLEEQSTDDCLNPVEPAPKIDDTKTILTHQNVDVLSDLHTIIDSENLLRDPESNVEREILSTELTDIDNIDVSSSVNSKVEELSEVSSEQAHVKINNDVATITNLSNVSDEKFNAEIARVDKCRSASPDQIDAEVRSINKHVICDISTSSSVTPYAEKIVPGAVSRGDVEEVPLEEIPNRPVTPHEEKIVPGAISRGDLEQIPNIPDDVVERKINNDEPKCDIDLPRSRPVTPHNEKIVPGSISRGDLNTPGEEVIKRPATPKMDKIVPGSISRGDLGNITVSEQLDEQQKNIREEEN